MERGGPPAGNDQTITLNTEDPSRLPLSAFKNISKFKLEGYSQDSFLVITVAPSDVVDGRLVLPSYSFAGNKAPLNEGISYILFDLSAISGDVEITSDQEPVRGSIYAPDANITFPVEGDGGKEFEGQLIAANLTALQGGKEIHTNLFKGRFDCGREPVGEPTATDEPTVVPTDPATAQVPVVDPTDDGTDPGDGDATPGPKPSPGLPSAGAGTAIPVFGAIAALAATAGALVIRRRHAR